MSRPIRTLLFSTLFPSSTRPVHGIFVETRLRELLKSGAVQTKVVAPVPWFPFRHPRFGDYARMAATPERETRHGIEVLHPRYPLLPKVGMSTAPLLLALAALPAVRKLQAEGFDFDVIDAHYYYPDGVAAAMLARWVGKPLSITARGTDLNLIPAHALPRAMMRWAAQRADASIGVCAALMDVLRGWGIDGKRLHVMRNGVDLERFRPLPQAQMRAELGLQGAPLLLSVGHLVERKGHHVAIDAMPTLLATHAQARLVIVGDGVERERLKAQARTLGVHDSVTFAGGVPNEQLLRWYSAADALILASSREGWANVLLEAMACGTPVVATRIWGTPEVVTPESGGVLFEPREGCALAAAVQQLLRAAPSREQVRRYAEGFSWQQTTQAQLDLFRRLSQADVACA
ncbi:glycosyltransferase family 4 protein [Azohydromonas caseinilytica]|uniref:Glycosyltransferase family 4 protein n=1 Tax=Azohydromonas caseinilytica TaxID=2728836 RepID=A0A848F4T3_9BURK|nr:glycosyltransferase family 4 protein [Azohydromonas caseinilytica]NML14412.1 glycosyltransferase family 4 protein [Azohydromonas caseinilytica]